MLQHATINRLYNFGIVTPKPVLMKNGFELALHESDNGDRNYVRLLHYISGDLQANIPQTTQIFL